MALHQIETEEAVRGYGHNSLRAMPFNLRPFVCAFAEAPIYHNGGSANGMRSSLPDVPPTDRSERARTDVPDHHEIDPFADWHGVEPMKFPEGCDAPLERMWYSRGRTDMMIQMHREMMPMIEEVIERASR